MIHLETKRQCIILRDEMKVLIVITLSTSLTTRSDDKEILDGLLSKMDEIEKDLDEAVAEARRRVDEVCATTQSSIVELHQCIKVWKEGCSQRDVETSCL